MHDRRGVVIAGVLTIASPAFAQEPAPTPVVEPPAPSKPEAPVAADPNPEQPAPPTFTLEPFGFLRLQYKVVQNDPFVAFIGRDDGFELQNARFGVRGKLLEKVAYKLSIDGAVDEREQVNVPDGKLRVGMRDAYADVALGGSIAVRAGYFETLVDPDLDDDTEREFVDRPLLSRGVRPTQGYQTDGLPPGRSLGAAIRMDPEPPASGVAVGFEVAVQNGASEFASDNDNDTPAISGSVLVRMPHRSWVVASGRWNRRTEGELPLQRDEDDFQGSIGVRVAAGPLAVGGAGFVQRTQYPTTGGPVRNAFGANAQVLVQLDGAMPVAFGYRFGILDPSSLLLTDRVIEHSVGATLAVPQLRMRVQLQLTHATEQGNHDVSNDRAQLAAELSL